MVVLIPNEKVILTPPPRLRLPHAQLKFHLGEINLVIYGGHNSFIQLVLHV